MRTIYRNKSQSAHRPCTKGAQDVLTQAETIMRAAKEFTLNASKTFAPRYSSLLSIVLAAILGRPEKTADCSRVANADVSRLYEPSPKRPTTRHCHVQGLPEGDVATFDFETMYRPMPASPIRAAHRTIGGSSRDHGAFQEERESVGARLRRSQENLCPLPSQGK